VLARGLVGFMSGQVALVGIARGALGGGASLGRAGSAGGGLANRAGRGQL